MKLAYKLSIFLLVIFTFGEITFSLTNYQIKRICEKEKKELTCLRNFREKKSNLQKGIPIEIPVIPYKK